MAEFPALPIFTDALLGDTMHLSNGQFGSYMLLLIVAWRTKDCSLPNDDVFLARVARMGKKTWAVHKSVIMSFWKLGPDDKFRQGRLTDERNYVEQLASKNSAAGKASALKRKKRHSTSVQPDGNQTSTPTPTPTPTPKSNIPITVLKAETAKRDVKSFGGIEALLDDDDLDKVRQRAPGWDKHHLFHTYDDHARSMGEPRDRKAAFFGWLKKYTGGKPPR